MPTDPIEAAIEAVLVPGKTIRSSACPAYAEALEGVLSTRIEPLIASDPQRAAVLCETFLAGCHAKAADVHDSLDAFSDFVRRLICVWIRARQAAGAAAEGTVGTLMSWYDDDPYCFCSDIETLAVAAFDKPGRAAFEAAVRSRMHGKFPHIWKESLRRILLASGSGGLQRYIALAEESGMTAKDCCAIAERKQQRDPVAALHWVERGLALRTPLDSPWGLEELHRKLLVRLGRPEEALDAAWKRFQEGPYLYSFEDLLEHAGQSPEWREKALEFAMQAGKDLTHLLELCLGAGDLARLTLAVARASEEELTEVYDRIAYAVAKALTQPSPAQASRMWAAIAVRILNEKQSKQYEEAVRCLLKARECDPTNDRIAEMRSRHFRKTAFVTALHELANPEEAPSFLEQAKMKFMNRGKP